MVLPRRKISFDTEFLLNKCHKLLFYWELFLCDNRKAREAKLIKNSCQKSGVYQTWMLIIH